jgi:hypothetical protein
MHQLLACLEHNELNDTALEKVCAGLESLGEHTHVQVLRTAVDAFEFGRAQTLLQQLVAEHTLETQA